MVFEHGVWEHLFANQQLAIERNSHQKSSFTSIKFAKAVIMNHERIRPQDANMFYLVAFRRNVEEFTQFINTGALLTNTACAWRVRCPSRDGFRVIGWFKPSKVEKNHLLRFTNSTLWPSIRLLSHCRNRRYDSDTPDHSRHHHRSDEFSVTKNVIFWCYDCGFFK